MPLCLLIRKDKAPGHPPHLLPALYPELPFTGSLPTPTLQPGLSTGVAPALPSVYTVTSQPLALQGAEKTRVQKGKQENPLVPGTPGMARADCDGAGKLARKGCPA